MKRIILLLLIFCTAISYAQIPETYPGIKKLIEKNKWSYDLNIQNKNKKDSILKQLLKNRIAQSNADLSYIFLNPSAKFSHILRNGNKVYFLPQDHMPCIVPNMSQFNMPNAGRNLKVNGMPPGTSPPYKIIPGEDK